ncbi:hypothetical protein PPERSA_07452 [Pseudocohnilembus persalinus]|uniref:Uncharacterized protein n=1 Tax=Pseudocohnilembus persalinus TaxID=266149 RepID=A0A0V0QAF8_PSEPJ|nr:hypothetical protein PPERSA_07452 [Pseudocohnilembus persalinus]|eukprot:KRW99209.1 hypothetical protein PPERSA_07452 [Pseudocohnilembus persalinus]
MQKKFSVDNNNQEESDCLSNNSFNDSNLSREISNQDINLNQKDSIDNDNIINNVEKGSFSDHFLQWKQQEKNQEIQKKRMSSQNFVIKNLNQGFKCDTKFEALKNNQLKSNPNILKRARSQHLIVKLDINQLQQNENNQAVKNRFISMAQQQQMLQKQGGVKKYRIYAPSNNLVLDKNDQIIQKNNNNQNSCFFNKNSNSNLDTKIKLKQSIALNEQGVQYFNNNNLNQIDKNERMYQPFQLNQKNQIPYKKSQKLERPNSRDVEQKKSINQNDIIFLQNFNSLTKYNYMSQNNFKSLNSEFLNYNCGQNPKKREENFTIFSRQLSNNNIENTFKNQKVQEQSYIPNIDEIQKQMLHEQIEYERKQKLRELRHEYQRQLKQCVDYNCVFQLKSKQIDQLFQ